MFFVKEERDGIDITVEITDENVYTICPDCGCVHLVDLASVFLDGQGDLMSTQVYCGECSAKKMAAR